MSASSQRAAAAGLPMLKTEQAMAEIVVAMLEDFHRTTKDAAFKVKIEQAYQAYTGAPFFSTRGANDANFVGVHLKGPPGHGKSTSFELAAKKFAELTGLNVVSNPPADFALSKNDFVIVTQEMAGEISNMTMGGLYDRRKGADGKGDVMTKIPYERFDSAKKAAAGLLLLDDVACAHESVQSALLGLIRNKVYQGHDYTHFFVGLTGNMGAADGAFAQKGSSALAGRVRMYYVEDDVELFSKRLMTRNNDKVGDAFVTSFLRAHPETFDADDSQLIDSESPRPQPRTWDSLSNDMRRIIHIYNTTSGKDGARSPYFDAHGGVTAAIDRAAAAHVGPKAAAVFSAYMGSMLTMAYPLAEKVVDKGPEGLDDMDKERLQRLAGRGVKNDGDHNQASFQMQFAEAVSTISAARIADAFAKGGVDAVKTESAKMADALYGVSRIEGVSIRPPYQAQAFYSLGSRLGSRADLTTSISDKIKLIKPEVFGGLIKGIADWSAGHKAKFGGSVPIGREELEKVIARAISGEAPIYEAGTSAQTSRGMTQ